MRCVPALVVALGVAWSQGARADFVYAALTPPGAAASEAFGINDRGDVVGSYSTDAGAVNGFVYGQGGYTTIRYDFLTATYVSGINNAGNMVGYYYLPFDSYPGGFAVFGGTIQSFNIPDARYTRALGINALGHVVGMYEDSSRIQHGFVTDGLVYTPRDYGAATTIAGINDRGALVGSYLGNNGYVGFLDDGSAVTTLVAPGAVSTFATGINALGQVVGYYQDAAGLDHGFFYSNGTFTTLDAPGGVGGTRAYGINARGQVVGRYAGANGANQAFIVAVPEPASLLLMAGGVGFVLAFSMRGQARPG